MIFKKIIPLLLAVTFIISNTQFIFAEMPQPPVTTGEAYVLFDQDSGRVLLSKNPDAKMYPASLTKLLTAFVAVDYIEKDELIVIGDEVNTVPWDSSLAGHKPNESITFENLLRGLLLPSGNDSATVIALEVARRETGNKNITLDEALKVFAKLMNEKAQSVGATNSHFITPHGYHNPDHYTTARDIGIIGQAAVKNTLIKEICSEKMFKGYGAGEKRTVDMFTQEYTWDNTNLLLGGRLSISDYIYNNATGVKTGSTSESGYCLVSTATNSDEENLVCVVMKSTQTDVWGDTKRLFEYGFKNYENVVLQEKNVSVKEVLVEKPQLGDEKILDLITIDNVSVLLNEDEVDKVTTSIVINEDMKSTDKSAEANAEPTIKTPISRGQEIGTLSFSLNGDTLYKGSIVAKNDVLRRTFKSDLVFYASKLKEIIFSWLIIPLSVAICLITVFGLRAYNIYKIKRTKRRRSQKYRFKTKY